MKQFEIRQKFLDSAEGWNQKHRLFGSNLSQRLEESVRAWTNASSRLGVSVGGRVVVDIGAGSGVHGFAATLLGGESPGAVVFIESDPKKAAFLIQFFSDVAPETKIQFKTLCSDVKNVSHETIATLLGCESPNLLLTARAFSGNTSLASLLGRGLLRDHPVLAFESKDQDFFLTELK